MRQHSKRQTSKHRNPVSFLVSLENSGICHKLVPNSVPPERN
jgi:hypothetical protein